MAFQALVLAGSRGGAEPVADYAGVSHKALIELGGQTLLARVLGALGAARRIAVVTNDAPVADVATAAGAEVLPAAAGPSQSVETAAQQLGTPLLVTTADHALLQAEWVERFLADAPADADICVLLARRDVVERDAPTTKRTYLKFADGEWSGCNLFLLATPKALGAVHLWRRVEADRKHPWRIARMLGPGILLRYLAGRLTLAEALARLGGLAGVKAAVVASPFGLAAVDVDKPADLDLVRQITGEV